MRAPARMIAAAALAALCAATPAVPQERAAAPADPAPALLVADSVYVTPDRTLVAEGDVQAVQGDLRLAARRIVYDRDAGSLTIEGPIRLIDPEGGVTVLADAAALSADLQEGLLTGARLVLDDQLQLAAVRMNRLEGRFTQLYKTAVTSCRICETGRPPLWQIRARRVIHDQEEQQLYFDDAQFRILDVPVFWLPRLRLPDPTLDRASGFLIPAIRSTSQLGTGFKVPYFFRLGRSRDLTLAPYVSSRTDTLDVRYRQAFSAGRIAFEGGVTRDELRPDRTRGYLFGGGLFRLPDGYVLEFDVEWASDNAYLLDYGHSDKDRLDSEIALTRVRRDSFLRAGIINYDSLRDGEAESRLPTVIADAFYERRYFPQAAGGELRMALQTHAHYRSSSLDSADPVVTGRDVGRISGDLVWRRDWTLRGLRADWQMGLGLDAFLIRQGGTFGDEVVNATPMAALTLRYPMTRATAGGGSQFLEPLLQVGWAKRTGGAVPNDESGRVEFDTGNILALSRFPARDVREDGLAVALGANWTHLGTAGRQVALSVGQIVRDTAQPAFSETSGLSGTSSDFLVAGQVMMPDGLSMTARTLFNDAFDLSKAELRGAWSGERLALAGSYLWLGEDAAENRARSIAEVYLDGAFQLNRHWSASANWRYDLADTRPATAGIGLVYRNECVEVDLSVRRRYTSSTSVEPSTDFGFSIALRGFGVSSGTERYIRTCNDI